MKTGQSQVLSIAGDPGGAAALIPVIEELQRDAAVNVHVYAYYRARDVFSQAGIDFKTLAGDFTTRQAEKLLADKEIDLLLSATSANKFNLEKKIILGARAGEIPSLAVLDFWSNYSLRFSMHDQDLECLPDKIAVMDQLAVNEMIAAGFPIDRLEITGQPAFEGLVQAREEISPQKIRKMRHHFGLQRKDIMVVFVSQPLSSLFDRDVLGYDEITVFGNLVKTLEKICAEKGRKITLVIFPHLRDRKLWWLEVDSEIVQIISASREDFRMIALSADLVTGMTSTKLVVAAMMGCRTVSLQIGAQDSMIFDICRLGVSDLVSDPSSLYGKVFETLFTENAGPVDRQNLITENATARVVQLVCSMLVETSTTANDDGKEDS